MLSTIQFRTFCLLICCLKCKDKVYKTIILPVGLFACETWSLTLRGEHRQRVFQNRVLREYLDIKRMK
jgi:hypothetical protein